MKAILKWTPYRITGIMVRNTAYLLLAGLVVADLARSGFRAGQQFRADAPTMGVSPLDSFSEPSAASAILKQEAERMLFNYIEARNSASVSEPSAMDDSRGAFNQRPVDVNPIHFAGFVRGSALEVSRIQPLEKLHATVQDLNLDLYQKLLLVYSENRFENELLDTFLGLLREAPDCPQILEWVRPALDCSQHCGRTAEVEDALQHTLCFHPELKTATQLAALVQGWELAHQTPPRAK